ncbi:NUDIX domain-containing [Pyrenophora seminiperda CCB06]|uniref:NUDIX domain-containing n=1 Tax=Pyrenophora seminiperda CCB06 TaxID=1302712 RepID=A0A3M7MGP6_9PLEO|nr:NUDIX domain-containing [Pyrenophora seminiperda CCB06]
MATSNYAISQYTSEEFVESSGAILFDLSSKMRKVCLIHYIAKDEWLLAKGRRNCGESRHEAALREVREETGYSCHLHPVTMSTRAPPMVEEGFVADEPRTFSSLTEPFMLTIRKLDGKSNVKLIWWYIATLDNDSASDRSNGEAGFKAEFFSWDEALERLNFEDDRRVLGRAVELMENSWRERDVSTDLTC